MIAGFFQPLLHIITFLLCLARLCLLLRLTFCDIPPPPLVPMPPKLLHVGNEELETYSRAGLANTQCKLYWEPRGERERETAGN